MSKKSPVTPFTRQGKILVYLLRLLLTPIHWLKGLRWQMPPPNFNDDPRHFSISDVVYFAYKYYYTPPLIDDAKGAVVEFLTQHPPQYCKPKSLKTAQSVTITAAGDLMPYEWIQQKFCPNLWDDIADDFFEADITFANLETPIDVSKPPSLVPEVMLNDMLFNADEDMFTLFNGGNKEGYRNFEKGKQGFDILSTANNHSLDMGEKGIKSTIDFLNKKGILAVGTALSEKDSNSIRIIEKNGIRMAFMAYTFSMNKFINPEDKPWLVNHIEVNLPNISLEKLKNDVILAKNNGAEVVILSLHGGNAYQPFPSLHYVKNIQHIFETCGVDIILGGHPHNVQPMIKYPFKCPFSHKNKEGFALFSFGDFIAYDIFDWCHLSVYVKITLEKSSSHDVLITEVKPTPVYAMGTYKNKDERDLRLLNAEKLLQNQNKLKQLPQKNQEELAKMMDFYRRYFLINQ